MKETTLDQFPSRELPELQRLIRAGNIGSAKIFAENVIPLSDTSIERESEFLRLVDISRNHIMEGGHSARRALILVAIGYYSGIDACEMPSVLPCPMTRKSIIEDFAPYGGPRDMIEIAFDALVAQGLFFSVHPGVFKETCYYSTYDPDFMRELWDGDKYSRKLETIVRRLDKEYEKSGWRKAPGWRTTGLCWGGGSQGPSSAPLNHCRGSACSWFLNGRSKCWQELEFNPAILPKADEKN